MRLAERILISPRLVEPGEVTDQINSFIAADSWRLTILKCQHRVKCELSRANIIVYFASALESRWNMVPLLA